MQMENVQLNTAGDRMRYFINTSYRSLADFSQIVQMDVGNLQKYLNNKRKPGSRVLERFEKVGCSSSWLLSGKGEMLLGGETYEHARKRALSQSSDTRLHEEGLKYPPNDITKALGAAMCPSDESILEGDDIILDQEAAPEPGDLVLHTREGYPKIERWQPGDPAPYAVCLRLMRNLRPAGK